MDGGGDGLEVRLRQLRQGRGEVVARVADEGPAQAVVEDAGEEVFRGEVGHVGPAAAQEGGGLAAVQGAQQIQVDGESPLPRRGGPGDLKDRRTADAEVRELYLALALRQDALAPAEGDGGVRPDALEGADEGGVRLHLDESGIEGRAAVAQGLQKLVAAHAAPQLAPGEAPGAEDDLLRRQGLLRRGDGEAPLRFPEVRDLKARAGGDPGLVQGEAQDIHHAARLVREGVDPAPGLRHREKAQAVEEVQGGGDIEAGEGIGGEIRGLAVVVGGRELEIRQVAAAVAGGQQLAAHPGLPLQQRHGMAPLPGGERRHHPGGPAADDQNFHMPSPFAARVSRVFLDYSRGAAAGEGGIWVRRDAAAKNIPRPLHGTVQRFAAASPKIGALPRQMALGGREGGKIRCRERMRGMDAIVVALISGAVTLLGVLIANSRSQAVTETKLDELTREVREHNNFARRMPVVEEQIKDLDRRLSALDRK